MALYEKFGLSLEGVDPMRQLHSAEKNEKWAAQRTANLRFNLSSIARDYAVGAVRFYLADDYTNAYKYGLACLPSVAEYFFGNWRLHAMTDLKKIDPSWWHDKESWMHLFSYASLWGSTLNQWDTLKQLAEYPDEKRGLDCDDATPALKQLYVELARLFRGENPQGIAQRVEACLKASWHATDVLAYCLDAIVAKDQSVANDLINKFFLAHHRRKRSKSIMDTISPDGTTVVNLAHHRGLSVELQPEFELYYLSLAN